MQMIFLPFFFFFQLSYALFVWWFDLLNIGCNGFFLENCKISLSNNITSINLPSLNEMDTLEKANNVIEGNV